MKGRILVFDDDRDQLSKIYIELLLQEFEVEVTSNPEEIIQRASRLKPDLVIVNSDVPGFNAEEICSKIKDTLVVPVALLLSKTSTSTVMIDGCKADVVIDKPVDTKQLSNTITNLISTYRS